MNYICKSSVLENIQVAVTGSPWCFSTRMFCCLFSVPTAPLNFEVNNSLSQQLLLTWDDPDRTNGKITFYEYCYTNENDTRTCNNTIGNSTNANITNLG